VSEVLTTAEYLMKSRCKMAFLTREVQREVQREVNDLFEEGDVQFTASSEIENEREGVVAHRFEE